MIENDNHKLNYFSFKKNKGGTMENKSLTQRCYEKKLTAYAPEQVERFRRYFEANNHKNARQIVEDFQREQFPHFMGESRPWSKHEISRVRIFLGVGKRKIAEGFQPRMKYNRSIRNAVRREIISLHNQGLRNYGIAARLNELGFKRPSGDPINEQFVANQKQQVQNKWPGKLLTNRQIRSRAVEAHSATVQKAIVAVEQAAAPAPAPTAVIAHHTQSDVGKSLALVRTIMDSSIGEQQKLEMLRVAVRP